MSERNRRSVESASNEFKQNKDFRFSDIERVLEELELTKLKYTVSQDLEIGTSNMEKIHEFCEKAAHAFHMRLWESLRELQRTTNKVPKSIINFFIEKKWDRPSFRVLSPKEASDWLFQNELTSRELFEKEVLVIFNLPKPLAHFLV